MSKPSRPAPRPRWLQSHDGQRPNFALRVAGVECLLADPACRTLTPAASPGACGTTSPLSRTGSCAHTSSGTSGGRAAAAGASSPAGSASRSSRSCVRLGITPLPELPATGGSGPTLPRRALRWRSRGGRVAAPRNVMHRKTESTTETDSDIRAGPPGGVRFRTAPPGPRRAPRAADRHARAGGDPAKHTRNTSGSVGSCISADNAALACRAQKALRDLRGLGLGPAPPRPRTTPPCHHLDGGLVRPGYPLGFGPSIVLFAIAMVEPTRHRLSCSSPT